MKLAILVLTFVCAVTPAARAGLIGYSDTTSGAPVWNRPVAGFPPTPPLSGVATSVPFHVQPFYVTGAAAFDFLSVATAPLWDNYTFLYQGIFDPLAQFSGVLIGNDDFPSFGQSGFSSVALAPGEQYFLVTTGFSNSDSGAFNNTITGPSGFDAVLGLLPPSSSIPEPSSLAIFGVMVSGVLVFSRRLARPGLLGHK